MPTFETGDGAELHYEVDGRGAPPLILIHGWCSNLGHWEHQVRAFRDSHRILRLDRRGLGKSTTPGFGHTPELHAADVAALARHEGISDAVVIAHAGGGPVGVYLSARYPELVRAYVMIDTSIMPAADFDRPTTRPARYYAEIIDRMTKPDGEAYFRELYRTFFDPRADRELVDSVVEEASRVPVDIRVKELRLLAADTATPAATMRQPILFIAGTWMADMFPQVLDRSRLRSIFPLAKSTDLALAIGTGHFEQLEVPEQTNAFLANFISRLI